MPTINIKFGIIIFFSLFYIDVFSQEELTVKVKTPVNIELTANATQFVKQYFSLSNNNFEVSPYLVGIRVYKKFHSIRAQIGINYSINTENGNFGGNKTEILSANNRLGYQKEMRLSNHFSTYLGFDLLHKIENIKSFSSNNGFETEQNIKDNGFGIAPTFGIQWNITSRIGVYTEVLLPIMQSHMSNSQISRSGGQIFENKSEANIFKITYTQPTTLYFTYKF